MSHLARQEMYLRPARSASTKRSTAIETRDRGGRAAARADRFFTNGSLAVDRARQRQRPARSPKEQLRARWMIPMHTYPERWDESSSDQRRYETWLLVETAAADAMAETTPASFQLRRRVKSANMGAFDIARIDEIERDAARRDRVHDRGRRDVGPGGPLAALRADLVGRRGHRTRAADARRLDLILEDLAGARRARRDRARSSTDARR